MSGDEVDADRLSGRRRRDRGDAVRRDAGRSGLAAAGAATLAAAAVLPNLVPALRAASVDPIAALRVN